MSSRKSTLKLPSAMDSVDPRLKLHVSAPRGTMRTAHFIHKGFSFLLGAENNPAADTSEMGSCSSGSNVQEAR